MGLFKEEPEPANGVEDGRGRSVEELGAHGDPARFLGRDDSHDASCSFSCCSLQRTSSEASDSGAASTRADRASSQFA